MEPRFLLASPGNGAMFVRKATRAEAILYYAEAMHVPSGAHVFCTSVPDQMGDLGNWVTIERGEVSFRPYVKGQS